MDRLSIEDALAVSGNKPKRKRLSQTPGSRQGVRKTYHHGDLKAALLEAALDLIEKHGVKGFTLKDAAALVGVSTAAPYRHFTDRDALLRELQRVGFGQFNAALAAGYASRETPADRLEELGVAYVLFALERPAYFRVMFGMSGGGDKAEGDEASGFLLLVEAVREIHPEASAQTQNDAVLLAWSMVHGFAMLQMEDAFVGMRERGEIEQQLRRTLRLMQGRATA